jgi:hypothetical protein
MVVLRLRELNQENNPVREFVGGDLHGGREKKTQEHSQEWLWHQMRGFESFAVWFGL